MMYGANPDQLDALAGQFRSAATLLAAAEKQLSAKLVSSPWHGPKADRFRADWSRRHRRDLAAARQFLAAGETALRRNAQEQRSASQASLDMRFGTALPVPRRFWWNGRWVEDMMLFAGGGRIWQDGRWIEMRDSFDDRQLGSATNFFDSLSLLARGLDPEVVEQWRPSQGVGFIFSGVGLGLSLLGVGNGGPIGTVSDGLGTVVNAAGAVYEAAHAAHGAVSKFVVAGGVLAVLGGGIGLAVDIDKLAKGDTTLSTQLSTASNMMTMAGGIAMVIPGGQLVGAALIGGAAVIEVGTYAAEHWDTISASTTAAVTAVGHEIDEVGRSIQRNVGSAFKRMGSLF
jgi:hypothetical protein